MPTVNPNKSDHVFGSANNAYGGDYTYQLQLIIFVQMILVIVKVTPNYLNILIHVVTLYQQGK